jgi:hypothetical protein
MNIEKFVNINWYIKRKPYEVHTEYDVFYLKICRRLFRIINELAIKHNNAVDLDEQECRALAYVITAYFEDVINGIGFWQSVVDLNRKHFKKRLPFFGSKRLEEEEQNFDDIISADVYYLLYINYVAMTSSAGDKTLVSFEKLFFYEATDKIFNYLLDIEEVPATTFYEDYLVPDEDFIDFKNKLGWFTFEGYLTGVEFILRMQDHRSKLMDEKTDKQILPVLMYDEKDRLSFEVPSVLTAYFPLDIFAGALRCNEAKKEEIKSLKLRPHGVFHIQNENATHIIFRHTATNEEFNVLKNSFNNPPDASKEEYWIATVAKWDNDYYVSGICIPSPYKGEEIYGYNIEMQHSFQKHFPAYREHVIKTTLNYRDEAFRYFGKELVEFFSGKELQEKLDAFNEWYFENISDKSKLASGTKAVKMQLPKKLIAAEDVALFIPPGDNFELIRMHKQLLEILQTPVPEKVTREELNNVIALLLDDNVSKDYWYYLRKNYTLRNLSLFVKCIVEGDEDFEAMMRIYKPHEFSPLKLPRFKTVDSERYRPWGSKKNIQH